MKIKTFWAIYIVFLAFVATLQVSVRMLDIVDALSIIAVNMISIAIVFGFPMVYLVGNLVREQDDPIDIEMEPEPLAETGPRPMITVIRGGNSIK